MVFQKPPAFDMNAWEKLGSPGWDWAHHDAAVKKSETWVRNPYHHVITSQTIITRSFHPPPKDDVEKFGLEFNPASFGTNGQYFMTSDDILRKLIKCDVPSGPIQLSYSKIMTAGEKNVKEVTS